MVKRDTVVNWARNMASQRRGVDADGVYGMQCVDLPSWIAKNWFGYPLMGNGVDITTSAKGKGWKSYRSGTIRSGAIFSATCPGSGHNYGHTGLVVSDMKADGTFQTIEQNVTGGHWSVGGPCTLLTRRISQPGLHIFEWVYPPYEDLNQVLNGTSTTPKPATNNNPNQKAVVGVEAKDITYGGHRLKAATLKSLLEYCVKYSCMPSGPICQIYLESWWGASNVGRTDNNWGGSTWGGSSTRPSGVKVTRGTARPANEGGHYMRFASASDYLKDYMYMICEQTSGGRKMYNVAPSSNFDKYVAGLFRSGGAQFDYAASGYNHYLASMRSIRAGMNKENGGYLDVLDRDYKKIVQEQAKNTGSTSANAKQEEEEKEVPYIGMAIHFGIRVRNNKSFEKGDDHAIYYYNGATNTLTHVPNPPAWEALKKVYKETTGYELKYYNLDENKQDDRWYKNLFAALNPNSNDKAVTAALDEFKKFITENT